MNSTITPSQRSDGQDWSRQWRAWLRMVGLDRGERAASGARVRRLEVAPGLVTATVQDRAGTSCDVEIRFAVWSNEQWQRVIDALGSQAIFAAQLLAGDLPPELERTVMAAGARLLPASLDELELHCTCKQAGDPWTRRPCEHLSAIFLALGEMLADDPWLLFQLRGRDQQSVLRGLRALRARSSDAPAAAAKPAGLPKAESGFYRAASVASSEVEIPPLDQQVEGFWGSSKLLDTFRPHIILPPVELVLLRRLGPPPMGAASNETYERLMALYRRISQEGLALAYAADTETGPHDNGDAGA